MKRILMIAYHFPPLHGSSGIQRTLKFVKHLPEFGWEPTVLTANQRAYPQTSVDQLADIPSAVRVHRAFALDTARHIAFAGHYPRILASPDRWRTWWLGAVPAGLKLIKQIAPDILWSTYPIPTAHVIAGTLQRLSGLPWVADFRDPMAQQGYPRDPKLWTVFKAIEERIVARATSLVFATPGAQRMYRERYSGVPCERFKVIENGFDEESFSSSDTDGSALNPGKFTLLHSGIIYPKERDPSQLFAAIASLLARGTISRDTFRLRFRAPVHDELLRSLARRFGIDFLVEVLPSIGYRDALQEMLRADALLVLQAANCNEQIPAKLYEYFRSRRPLLALTDADGDTARTMREGGFNAIAPLDNPERIAATLADLLAVGVGAGAKLPDEASIARHSRRNRTAELARLLDSLG